MFFAISNNRNNYSRISPNREIVDGSIISSINTSVLRYYYRKSIMIINFSNSSMYSVIVCY